MHYSTIISPLSLLLLLSLCLLPLKAGAEEGSKLRFGENGSFKIVQFSDIHWGNGLVKDKQSQALMDEILEIEQPDFVVLTGDIIGGAKSMIPARQFEKIMDPIIKRKIPWAPAFGNHDNESPASNAEMMSTMQSLPGCMGQHGPEEVHGVGNFVLPIYASGEGEKIAALLYFLDSNGYPEQRGVSRYDWIRPNQVQWYRQEATRQRQACGEILPAMAFFHIPLPEYHIIWDRKKAIGSKHESIASPTINSGLFAAFLEQGDVMAMSVGHDHINDFIGELAGIWMCYCRGTGFDTYGKKGWPRGSRVFVLEEGLRDFSTWQRLEEGKVIEQKTLENPDDKERHTPLYKSYLTP